jgi:hypothetical protein
MSTADPGHVHDVPDFPIEALGGGYSICPACLEGVFPRRSAEVAHYRAQHPGVIPTAEQVAAAQARASQFEQELATDQARAAVRRRAQRAGRHAVEHHLQGSVR